MPKMNKISRIPKFTLGVHVNKSFNFNEQCEILLIKPIKN